MSTHPNSHSL